MTTDTAPRTTAPATGLFGGGNRTEELVTPHRGEPSATQRKAFAQLFRADGEELHAV